MYEVPFPCQKDRLRENRTGGAKREGFVEDLGHRLPRGIVLCVHARVCVSGSVNVYVCMFFFCVVTWACISYTTDFLIRTNYLFNIASYMETLYLQEIKTI